MKVKLLLVLSILTLGILTGCNSNNTTNSTTGTTGTTEPPFEYKENEGIAAIFDEELGFYNKDASILQLDANTRIIYYTTNKSKDTEGDVIAYRKGTITGEEWTWSDKVIVLEPTQNNWDSKRVSNPDVVKGVFNYNGVTYNYLMAYQGNNIEANKNYQIGLAFASSPEGPWVKYENPFITYNPDIYGSQFGAGQPSLVSFNEEGQVRLFYTFADELLTSTRLMELDLSDMDHVIGRDSYLTLSVKGLEDRDLSALAMMNNADFAIDNTTNTIYVVRDRNPYASSNPAVAENLQLAEANLSILYRIEPTEPTWTIIDKSINDSDTATGELSGWQRIFSGSIVTDAYGRVIDTNQFEICFSSSAIANSPTDTSYTFTPAIHIITINK